MKGVDEYFDELLSIFEDVETSGYLFIAFIVLCVLGVYLFFKVIL